MSLRFRFVSFVSGLAETMRLCRAGFWHNRCFVYPAVYPEAFFIEGQDSVWKIVIPNTERAKVLRTLDKYNLNAFSLFDSEEGLMETLAVREIDLGASGDGAVAGSRVLISSKPPLVEINPKSGTDLEPDLAGKSLKKHERFQE